MATVSPAGTHHTWVCRFPSRVRSWPRAPVPRTVASIKYVAVDMRPEGSGHFKSPLLYGYPSQPVRRVGAML